jgi:hypothetical protein
MECGDRCRCGAPYFRILNPWTQSARFDPDGEYVKKWIPELQGVPARRFFEPPASGERLADGYPAPVVDHARAREKALELFGQYGGAHAPQNSLGEFRLVFTHLAVQERFCRRACERGGCREG